MIDVTKSITELLDELAEVCSTDDFENDHKAAVEWVYDFAKRVEARRTHVRETENAIIDGLNRSYSRK